MLRDGQARRSRIVILFLSSREGSLHWDATQWTMVTSDLIRESESDGEALRQNILAGCSASCLDFWDDILQAAGASISS